MKKLIQVLLITCITVSMAACGSSTPAASPYTQTLNLFTYSNDFSYATTVTDKETGCQYILLRHKSTAGVTSLPRYANAQGEIYCKK